MIQKISFRDQIRDLLILDIISGNLRTGQKLSLADLSKKLNVSATPIREALTQLEQSGIISYRLNQGFYIKKIDLAEAKDIYEVIGFMEGLAVKQSAFSKQDIKHLKVLQKELQDEKEPLERLKKDYKFHQALIESYSNESVKNVLENLKATVYINELEYMKSDFINKSNITHLDIIEQIESKKLNKACKTLKEHWFLSYDFLKKCDA